MNKNTSKLLTCAALAAHCAGTASAGALPPTYAYGNVDPGNTSTTSNTSGYLNSTQSNELQAQGFTMGSFDWVLQEVKVSLGSSGSPSPVMSIYSDSLGSPSSALATFTTTAAVSANQLYSFTGSFTAQKNTSYWVVLNNANSTLQESFEWYSNDAFTTPSQQNTSGISYLGTKEKDGANVVGGAWNSTLPSLEIGLYGTTVVPEPSALTLLGLGTIGIIARRRRTA